MTDEQLLEKLEEGLQKLYKYLEGRYGKNREQWSDYANGEYDGYEACVNAFKRGINR